MKQVLLLIFSIIVTSSFGQVLRSNGSSLILVDSTNNERQLSNTEFKKCNCTEYVDDYEISENPGKIYHPKFNDQNQIILKNQNDDWVLVSSEGKQLFTFSPQSWSGPIYYEKGRYSIHDEDTTYIFNINHKLVKKRKTNRFKSYGDAYLWADDQGRFAILDIDGNVRIPYDHSCTSWDAKNFSFSSEGLVSLKNGTGKCGVVNFMGDTILPFIYDYIDDPHSEENYIEKDGFWGTIDKLGKTIVPMIYDELPYPSYYNNTFNIVKKDGKWMITDSALIPVSDKTYEDIREVKMRMNGWHYGKYRIYTEQGKSGLLNASGEKLEFLTDAIYDSITVQDTFYLAHSQFEIVIYEEQGRLNRTMNRNSHSFYDDFGNEIISSYKKKRILVVENDLKGIESFSGESIIECQYDKIEYKDNYFLVWVNKKVGLIDWEGKKIIEPIYDLIEIERYMDDSYRYQVLIKVKDNQTLGIMNGIGEIVIPVEYDQILWVNLTEVPHYVVVKKKKHGLVDSKNQIIVPFNYKGSCITDKKVIREEDNYYGHTLIFYNKKNATQFLLNGKMIESKMIKKSDEPCLVFD